MRDPFAPSHQPRAILGLPAPVAQHGESADLLSRKSPVRIRPGAPRNLIEGSRGRRLASTRRKSGDDE